MLIQLLSSLVGIGVGLYTNMDLETDSCNCGHHKSDHPHLIGRDRDILVKNANVATLREVVHLIRRNGKLTYEYKQNLSSLPCKGLFF